MKVWRTKPHDHGKIVRMSGAMYRVQANGSLQHCPSKPLSRRKVRKLTAKINKRGFDSLTTIELARLSAAAKKLEAA